MSSGRDAYNRLGSFEQTRASIAERLRARRVEIEQAIFTRVQGVRTDPASREDGEYLAGVRATVAAVLDYALAGIERGDESPAVVPSAAMVHARRAARAGVGLDTVLRRYVAGYAVLEDFTVQEADHSALQGQRTALRGVLETSVALLDRLIPSITNAYMQELERTGSAPRAPAPAPERRKHSFRATNGRTPDASREQVVWEQRARISQALVSVLAERGSGGATVELVVRRARVSTRTFYQCFDGLQECLIAIMDSVLEQTVALARQELQSAECWQEGVRSALAAVLSYFDREPELARVCIVETLAGGPVVLAHRERLIEAFRSPVLQRVERELANVSPLAAEGVMSSVLGIMHAHIITGKPGPFIELLGPLMGLIMAPYLGARRVQQEITQGDQLARRILAGDSRWSQPTQSTQHHTEAGAAPHSAVFAGLASASARRARECVLFLAEHPDSSNREVAEGIGIAHQSQISRLLTSLLQDGLASKRSQGTGKRNAWRLTPHGQELARALSQKDLSKPNAIRQEPRIPQPPEPLTRRAATFSLR